MARLLFGASRSVGSGLAQLIIVLFAVSVGFAASAPSAAADQTLDKIRQTHKMIVGTGAVYPPFEFVADGKIIGFDVDMGTEIARRMGVKIEWQDIDFKGIVSALKSGRVDLLISALTRTPARAEQIAFSEPYYDAGIGAAFRTDQPIAKPDDLRGKIVGVQLGTSGEAFVRDSITGIGEIKTYDSIILALKDLENKRIEAVVNPLPAIKYNLHGVAGIGVTGVWKSSFIGINTRKEDVDLLAEINRQLEAMKRDGTLQKLAAKWF